MKISKSSRSFYCALSNVNKMTSMNVIAEIKKASPSKGLIFKGKFVPEDIAKTYEKSGAAAISVLCDKRYFHGSLIYLKRVSSSISIPILCKDFIIDEYQIYEARKHGADAILLMASVLNNNQIQQFLKVSKDLGMDSLVEVHNKKELEEVLKTDAQIIGINNRDLKTLKINLLNTNKLIPIIPQGKIIVSESGIISGDDVKKLSNRVNAVLVGTSIMASKNIESKLKEIISAKKIIKFCGIRTVKDAEFCEKNMVNLVGLNFVSWSNRKVNIELAKKIREKLKLTKAVGVFYDKPISEVNNIAKNLNLDYIQLSGSESINYVKKCCRPVIKSIALEKKSDIEKAKEYLPYVSIILFDNKIPGSGKESKYKILNDVDFKYIIAGGINSKNIKKIFESINPLGFDTASGIEDNGIISIKLMSDILKIIKRL